MNEESLFAEAAGKKAEARAAFLDQHCKDNPVLRQRLEDLLRANDNPDPDLEPATPRESATVHEPNSELPGTVIGPYKLLEQIDEGGMGLVFMAEQAQPVCRKVALKVLKPGLDTRDVIARFEAERQALAMMDHAHIARVLDAGTTSAGRPYFVMDLVKGVPITKYCDEHHLTPRQRLELFLPVCHAIQHAHQKGIIHRDLKPSNVLVAMYDGKPVPKVIDFSVAKATGPSLTDKTLVTGFGAIVGTLEYMSPEQAQINQLDIDTRSDIYSLGVLLYELLAGSPPFIRQELERGGVLEMLRLIREQEPPRPSTRLSTAEGLPTLAENRGTAPARLTKLVRGELDWIVMKALEKERSRRYETAIGLALDVQRYLADEPVLAGPPSAIYKLRKFVRRNRGPVLALALVLLALVIGSIGAMLGLIEARRQESHATAFAIKEAKARAEEAVQRKLAQGNERKANTEKDRAEKRLTQIEKINDILGSIFKDLDPRAAEKEGIPLQTLLGKRLDQATSDLEDEAVGDPLAVAKLQMVLGLSQLGLGYAEKAITLFSRARATYSAKLGSDDPVTLNSMNSLAGAFQAAGKLELALPLFQETVELMKAKLGPEHPDTLNSRNNLAAAYRDAGELDLALALFDETLKLIKAKLGPEHPSTLTSMNNLAGAYQAVGKLDLALPMFEETLRLMKANGKLGPEYPDTLGTMNNLAGAYQAAGKLDLALAMFKETLKVTKDKLGPDHPDTLGSMNNLALAFLAAGKLDLALTLLDETLKLAKEKQGRDHPDTLSTMNNLALAYQKASKFDLALPLFEETLKLAKRKVGPVHPRTLTNMNNLAWAYQADGKLDLALPLFKETFELMKAKLGPQHPDTLTTMKNLAGAYQADGKLELALPLFEETLRIRKTKLGPEHPDTVLSTGNLAWAYFQMRRFADAEPLLTSLIDKQRRKVPADNLHLALLLKDLGECRVMLKHFGEAETHLRDSLAIYQEKLPNSAMRYGTTSLLGAALAGQRKYTEAEPLLVDSAKVLVANAAKLSQMNRQLMLAAVQRVIDLYDAWGRPDDAAKWRKKLDKLKELPK
jgi:serine/threonine protein kinase/Tfp pilus assembly protein PilF